MGTPQGQVLSERTYASEWLKHEIEKRYTLAVDTITAVAEATAGMPSGQIMQGAVGAKVKVAAGPATAVLFDPVTLAEHIAGCKKLMLVRGPAVVDSDKMIKADASDLTDLAALDILAVNSGLATWDKQTT